MGLMGGQERDLNIHTGQFLLAIAEYGPLGEAVGEAEVRRQACQ